MAGTGTIAAARQVKHLIGDAQDAVLTRVGLAHPESRLVADARDYWNTANRDGWRSNSHWRDGDAYTEATWRQVGAGHYAMWESFAKTAGFDRPLGRVVEWGCGGGANAVWFAPAAAEFVGVDVSQPSLDECGRQVADVCNTRFMPVLADVARPEVAAAAIAPGCDLFLCYYVLELVPSPEYGLRILDIARSLLADDGLAVIQIKYRTGSWRTASKRRRYWSSVAQMTTYRIEEFWQHAEARGLVPLSVQLVPKNEMDERYAYYLLRKA